MRWSWVSVLLVLSALACKKTDKSYVVLTFNGTVDRPISSIEITLGLGARSDTTSFQAPAGSTIQLPTTAALEVGSGEGTLTVSARALDSSATLVAEGVGSGSVSAGQSSSISVLLTASVRDAGADAFIADDGSSPAKDALAQEQRPPSDLAQEESGGSPDVAATGGAGGSTSPRTVVDASAAGGTGGTITQNTAGSGGAGGTTGSSAPIGYKLTATPVPLDLGPVPAGGVSQPQPLTITNIGDQPAPPLTVFVDDGTQFPIYKDRCSGTALGPGLNCLLYFTFNPNTIGPTQTKGSVTPDQGQPIPFVLTGRGLSTAPQISMTPNTVDFNTVDVGISSPIDFKVTSTGGSDPGTVDILLNGSEGFSVVNDGCTSMSLPNNGQCTFTLVFSPTTFGQGKVSINAKTSSGASATSYATGVGRDFVKLAIILAGNGKGSVTWGSLNCRPGMPCSIGIPRTDPAALPKVNLTAQPDAASQFAGWGGACLGMDACSFVMDGPKEVKAIFNTL